MENIIISDELKIKKLKSEVKRQKEVIRQLKDLVKSLEDRTNIKLNKVGL